MITDTDLINFLAKEWDSQGTGHFIMGRWFPNVSGSFRDAILNEFRNINDYFESDGAPKKCLKCDSTNFTEKVIAKVDLFEGMGPTCEAEYYCECGECVGFWAYGQWSPSP